MGEDGACLFRAVADQLYGDEEMHHCVRAQCMDYIVSYHSLLAPLLYQASFGPLVDTLRLETR